MRIGMKTVPAIPVVLAFAGLMLAAGARAQTTGSIDGAVTASDGSPLPSARVEASGGAPGVRASDANGSGLYHLPTLPPGTYRVTATMAGFQPATRTVIVSLGVATRADFRLSLEEKETVTVQASPLINLSSTEVGHTLDARAFTKIPLSRDYTSVALLLPGVTTDNVGFSINGATGLENAYYVDGVNVTGIRKGEEVKTLPEEFLQEVQVKTGNFSAEYGEAFGGIIDAITRSGGNQYHGQVFGYFDNASLQARAKPGVIGSNFAGFTDSDIGAGLGGYLKRDKLWFFGVYDRKFLQEDTHLVTGSGSPYDGTTFRTTDRGQDLYSLKLTWSLSPSTALVGSVIGNPYSDAAELPEDAPPATRQIHDRGGRPDYSLMGNSFGRQWAAQLGVFRHQEFQNRTPDNQPPFLTTDSTQVPTWNLSSCPLPGCYAGAPYVFESALFDPLIRQSYTRQEERGSFTYYAGNHDIKGGAEYSALSGNVMQSIPGGYARIFVSFEGIPVYNQIWFGDPTGQFGSDHVVSSVSGHPRTNNAAAYLQDTWQTLPNLTINAGVRYSSYVVHDAVTGGRIMTLNNNFAPRVGVAWDPGHDGKSAVTAAYGRFFEAIPMDHQATEFSGTNLTVSSLSGYSFDCGSNAVNCQSASNLVTEPADPGLRAPMSEEFSLSYRRALTPTFSVGIEGIYSRLDRAVEDRCDLKGNAAALDFTGGNGCVFMNPGMGSFGRGNFAPEEVNGTLTPILCTNGLNQQEGRAAVACPALPQARRLFRGVAVTAEKRFSPHAYMLASYLYSSLRGNYDGTFNELGESDPNTNLDFDYPGLLHDAYGKLTNDRPQQVKVAGFYSLPFGLTAGVNAYYRSGTPEDKLGSFNDVAGAPIPLYLAPRGSVGRLPADYDADLHLDYSFPLGPISADAIVDVFRVLNRQAVLRVNPFYNFDGFQADNNTQTNAAYGLPIERANPRLLRFGMRLSF